MEVPIKLDGVAMPEYQTKGSAGFDLAAAETTMIFPRAFKLVPTGTVIQTPQTHVLLLTARSSLFKRHRLMLSNGIGVIDSDYSGEEDQIMIPLVNLSEAQVQIRPGERIAQGLFVPVDRAQFVKRAAMGSTSRGGFGSTG